MTPRNQNAKAYVNGAMLASVVENADDTVTVQTTPRILLGGISSNFFHAESVEAYLVYKSISDAAFVFSLNMFASFSQIQEGKNMNSQNTLNGALTRLESDVTNALGEETPDTYQLHLAKALLYKVSRQESIVSFFSKLN